MMTLTDKLVATLAARVAVTVVSAAAVLLPTAALADDHGRGAELFVLCTQCHGPDGGGMEMALAPAIAGLDQWYVEAQLNVFRSGARGLHPEDIGGMRMYPMSRWLRSEEDVKAVSAYVASLPKTNPEPVLEGGDAAKGQQLYATCLACHGDKGQGNQTVASPPLAGTSDWYILSTLQKYKAGIRGANPANPKSMQMGSLVGALLPNEQAMRDVVAHISTLNN